MFLASTDPVLMSLKEGYKKSSKVVFKAPIREKKSIVVNGIDLLENVPPRTENEVSYDLHRPWRSETFMFHSRLQAFKPAPPPGIFLSVTKAAGSFPPALIDRGWDAG